MKWVAKGAEAELYRIRFHSRQALCKRRVRKHYRVPALDQAIRTSRTRNEARLLSAAKQAGVRCPLILGARRGKHELVLEELRGTLLAPYLKTHALPRKRLEQLGQSLALLHDHGIVHGDFTTSNVIVLYSSEMAFIDFGLGRFSASLEDQATDLLLFKKSSTPLQFAALRTGYCKTRKKCRLVLGRLDEIERRGRYVVRAQAN
ncbi:Kae1-associated serine/threonine protein kinase [Candidatus Micrarchaeota archaeon]|nr:Kae1-associated serine/threonine protein kinase [Candidatus Micrarchaeota archaeon]